ncbi:hypothetical protein FKW77_005953 [Venturia effusa]|uniref:Uncharacterized protein n=1 Tax=Venturia effusa TaxID=50376 RepID=A0A517L9F5_9PEZI|nr:hypothetical protein FKW77_005953 [Venturia effusa]
MFHQNFFLISTVVASVSAVPAPTAQFGTAAKGPNWTTPPPAAPAGGFSFWTPPAGQPRPNNAPYPNQPYSNQVLPYPNQALPYPNQALPYPNQALPYPNQALPYPNQALPYPNQALPYPNQALPYPNQPPFPSQPAPVPLPAKGQNGKSKPYIENDASGFTVNGPLGTYHKGPDGTYIKGGLGTIDAQKGAPATIQGALGTLTTGAGGVKYDPFSRKGGK